jgi:ABC-type glycerol-3-phosphate transport system substrate-binding protein
MKFNISFFLAFVAGVVLSACGSATSDSDTTLPTQIATDIDNS